MLAWYCCSLDFAAAHDHENMIVVHVTLPLAMPSAGTLKTQGGGGWLLLGHLFCLLCQVQDSEDSGGWWVVTTMSPLPLAMPSAGL